MLPTLYKAPRPFTQQLTMAPSYGLTCDQSGSAIPNDRTSPPPLLGKVARYPPFWRSRQHPVKLMAERAHVGSSPRRGARKQRALAECLKCPINASMEPSARGRLHRDRRVRLVRYRRHGQFRGGIRPLELSQDKLIGDRRSVGIIQLKIGLSFSTPRDAHSRYDVRVRCALPQR